MYSIHSGLMASSGDRETQYLVTDLYDNITNRRVSMKHILTGLEKSEVEVIENGQDFVLRGPRFSLYNRNALSFRVELSVPWSALLNDYPLWINENIEGCWSFQVVPYVDWQSSARESTYMFFFQNKEDALFFKLKFH